MKRFKKVLAALLATLMVVCSMPLTALAYEYPDVTNIISLKAYAQDRESWGPYLESGEGEGEAFTADTDLYEGDCIALAWVLHDLDVFAVGQIKGYLDADKIAPAYYVKKGTKYNLTEGADAGNFIAGMESHDNDNVMLVSNDENAQIEDGMSSFIMNDMDAAEEFYWPLGEGVPVNSFSIVKMNMKDPGDGNLLTVNLTGETVFNYVYNPEAPDDYDGQYVMDGTLYAVTRMLIKQDMKVSDLYDCIHLEVENRDINFMTSDRWTLNKIAFEEYSGTITPTEATYTFADGSTTTAAEAPDNTVVDAVINNNNGTHTTGYEWVADGDNAFKEQAVTAKCSNFDIATVDTTCSTLGYDEYTCRDCGYTYKDNMATEYGDHDFSVEVGTSDATCVTPGTTTYKCAYCTETNVVEGEKNPANHANVVTDKAVEATCTTPGKTEGSHCEDCGEVIVAQQETPVVDHAYSEIAHTDGNCITKATTTYRCKECGKENVVEGDVNSAIHANVVTDAAVEATCTTPGKTEGSHCAGCGEVIVAQEDTALKAHDFSGEGVVTKAPTRAEDGVMTYTCTTCGVATKEEPIEALGVLVTVDGKELGTATINGEDAYGTTKVKYASSYTLTAAPAEGAEFVGWMANGKMLTNEASYTTAAYADMTYTPVFAEVGQAKFTVTFVDTYGNVISVLDNNAVAALSEMPATNELAGYTFKEWSMTLDEVKALTDSATVYAYYESDEANAYTITATGCTINVNGVDYTDFATGVAYNSKVTITPAESVYAAWSTNGALASYGETYSFICGSDIEVTYAAAEAAVPTVAAVSATKTATSNVAFLATRSVPEGYTLIESGFVYGKAMAQDDLVLENVGTVKGTDNGVVKSIACRNVSADGQFSLTYGVSRMNQNACARAYLIYADAAGATHAIYSDAMIYTY